MTIDNSKIGMSDLSTVVGLNPFSSPIQLVERIKHGRQTESTLAMELGHHMEPFLIRRWELQTGGKSKGPRPLALPKHPFLRANLDADAELNGSPLVVDGKNTGYRMAGHWGDGEDEIPEWMIPQMQGYLWATKYERCDVVAMLGGSELRIYTVRPDVELQEMLIEAAAQFWKDYIEGDKLPPPDATEAYKDFLHRRFPKHEKPLIPATTEMDLLASMYRAASENVDRYTQDMDNAKNRLKALIGDAEGVQGNGYRITWKAIKGSLKTDWQALANELHAAEDLIQKHTTIRPGPRVFRLSTGGSKS